MSPLLAAKGQLPLQPYLIFVPGTTGSAGVKCSAWCQTKCERVCFGVKILNFVFFGVNKSGISAFLVSNDKYHVCQYSALLNFVHLSNLLNVFISFIYSLINLKHSYSKAAMEASDFLTLLTKCMSSVNFSFIYYTFCFDNES